MVEQARETHVWLELLNYKLLPLEVALSVASLSPLSLPSADICSQLVCFQAQIHLDRVAAAALRLPSLDLLWSSSPYLPWNAIPQRFESQSGNKKCAILFESL